MTCCSERDAAYDLSIKQIDDLASRVDELSFDRDAWIVAYRCRVCGQCWEEAFIERGHGEVPLTRKIAPPAPGA
jgi:hypothetical protein